MIIAGAQPRSAPLCLMHTRPLRAASSSTHPYGASYGQPGAVRSQGPRVDRVVARAETGSVRVEHSFEILGDSAGGHVDGRVIRLWR